MSRTTWRRARPLAALGALILGAALDAAPTARECTMSAGDRAWLERALAGWEWTSRSLLGLDDRAMPRTVLLDARCAWHLAPAPTDSAVNAVAATPLAGLVYAGAPLRAVGVPHDGMVSLPNGARVPARLTAFAAPLPAGGGFLTIALPSLWRASPRYAADGALDTLVLGVFMHEAAHTRQAEAVDRAIGRVAAESPLPDDLDDDVVQRRFGERPGYRAAYERERDLLFRAAAAPDRATRRALAREALAAMRERRARWFTGADSMYAALEGVFLTLEGVGNWTALGYMRSPRGLGLGDEEAMRRIRGGKGSWTQEQGLALFLVIDGLLPGWQRRALGVEGASALTLLEEAVR